MKMKDKRDSELTGYHSSKLVGVIMYVNMPMSVPVSMSVILEECNSEHGSHSDYEEE